MLASPPEIQEIPPMTTKRSPLACVGLLATIIAMLFAGSSRASGQTEHLIYSFPSSEATGCGSEGDLVADSAGNLYGVTNYCGTTDFTQSVYKLSRPVPPDKVWTETVLYTFPEPIYPQGDLIFDAAGNLYGTASSNNGLVYELSPPAAEGGQWTENTIYAFQGPPADGAGPSGGLVLDSKGNLYGVTFAGGNTVEEYGFCIYTIYGCGIAYELSPAATPGGPWTETVIHRFVPEQGFINPVHGLVFDDKGNLYGSTTWQEANDREHYVDFVAYKLTPPASGSGAWTPKLLTTLGGVDQGDASTLTIHNNGRLYGTISANGPYGWGSVFELVPPAAAGEAWSENILYSFEGGTDGSLPMRNVIFDEAGNLYSTTSSGGSGPGGPWGCPSYDLVCGTVFELTPPASEGSNWTKAILYNFPAPSTKDGSEPISGLTPGRNGALLGVTSQGGIAGVGTVYAVVP
jgi:hypothetical protein